MKQDNNFNHFVITQFNLRNLSYGIKNTEEWINWTRERIVLFKSYTLPSFLNQTNKNFKWLIYFDSTTPSEFNHIFKELNSIDFIKIFFVNGNNEFMTKYLDDIKNLNLKNKKWVITTRCDNDDCLEKDAINTIQNYFIPKDEYLISLASGYTLNIKDYTLSHYYYPKSPFISIIESYSKENLKGIFFNIHTKWNSLKLEVFKEVFNKNKESVFILNKPLWLQIIHGNNVANGHRRGLPVLKSVSLNNFGINIKTNGQSVFSIFNYREYYYWKRYFKSIIVRLLK